MWETTLFLSIVPLPTSGKWPANKRERVWLCVLRAPQHMITSSGSDLDDLKKKGKPFATSHIPPTTAAPPGEQAIKRQTRERGKRGGGGTRRTVGDAHHRPHAEQRACLTGEADLERCGPKVNHQPWELVQSRHPACRHARARASQKRAFSNTCPRDRL